MANIFKAKEIYKHTPSNINPNKPFVALRGLYVAGAYRSPYWVDAVLNITKLSTTTAADVVYYTSIEETTYDSGVLRIKNISLDDGQIVEYTSVNVSGYEQPEGILRIKDVSVGEPSIVFYTSIDHDGYDTGILRIKNVSVDNFQVISIPIIHNEQPPGQPILNIKQMNTVVANIT
jgi:hypothetical protein